MKSRVHPKYKTKYRVSNWTAYDEALVPRGDLTLWISEDAIESWNPAPSGKRGGQRKFFDHAIETALTLRLVFKLPLRQTEGFLRSILSLMGIDLEAPDHTTLSRRSQHLDVGLDLVASNRPIHLIVDSTGLSIVGQGEWAAVKHGGSGKRTWKKLHLGIDRFGSIVAEVLTDGNVDDSNTAIDIIDEVKVGIASFTADAAYDTTAIYEAAAARGAEVIVPPRKTATNSRRPGARDRTVRRVKEVERRQWKRESGYHQQGRVENTVFRYKSIIGPRLRARHPKSQKVKALIACNILNRMFELGRPKSFAMK
ncbi:MAG: transposase [Myxococcota bacterium]|jgi:transposase